MELARLQCAEVWVAREGVEIEKRDYSFKIEVKRREKGRHQCEEEGGEGTAVS